MERDVVAIASRFPQMSEGAICASRHEGHRIPRWLQAMIRKVAVTLQRKVKRLLQPVICLVSFSLFLTAPAATQLKDNRDPRPLLSARGQGVPPRDHQRHGRREGVLDGAGYSAS